MQIAVKLKVKTSERGFSSVLHSKFHNLMENRKVLKGNQIIVLTQEMNERIVR